ncbi:hypothetical protein FQN57_000140 [Myotisia sp. PD_48]|nr:hypothetical protein FQN57_000140 [Myotisia sp. PD_48]
MSGAAAAKRVLLLGGHGKVSLFLTPLLLARGWDVISVIRDPSQENDILKVNTVGHEGCSKPCGKVSVLISSLEDVKQPQDADHIIKLTHPDYIVWSAGAGGKGGFDRTYAIDQDAAKNFIQAGMSNPSVSKFLLISHLGSRRKPAPWWSDKDWDKIQKINSTLPHYYKAKLEADEFFAHLYLLRTSKDPKFQAINLRPTYLSDEPATKKVEVGRTSASGPSVSREDVAIVADRLLARSDTRGYYDLVDGDTPVDEAVELAAKANADALEGEDITAIHERFTNVTL